MRFFQRLRSTIFSRTTVLAVVTVLVITLATLFGSFEFLELKAVDAAFNLRGPLPPTAPIVIVAVDDESIRETQLQWPWPRSYMAQLISKIAAGQPKTITVDVFWYEPGQDPCCSPELINAIKSANDEATLQQAIRNASGTTPNICSQFFFSASPIVPSAGSSGFRSSPNSRSMRLRR